MRFVSVSRRILFKEMHNGSRLIIRVFSASLLFCDSSSSSSFRIEYIISLSFLFNSEMFQYHFRYFQSSIIFIKVIIFKL